MPYKRVAPATLEEMENAVPLRQMEKERWHGHYTICQKLRDMFHSLDDTELKMECRIMMAMAKKMHEKLKYYREKEELQNARETQGKHSDSASREEKANVE